jgi:hypothetical protein
MPPKRKLEVEFYKSIETRIQEAIDILEERGEEKPNLAAAAREFELLYTTKTTSEIELSIIEE